MELASTQMKALSLIREIVKYQDSLNRIALKKGERLPVDGFINILIKDEGSQHQPGFEQRIVYLQRLKEVNHKFDNIIK